MRVTNHHHCGLALIDSPLCSVVVGSPVFGSRNEPQLCHLESVASGYRMTEIADGFLDSRIFLVFLKFLDIPHKFK